MDSNYESNTRRNIIKEILKQRPLDQDLLYLNIMAHIFLNNKDILNEEHGKKLHQLILKISSIKTALNGGGKPDGSWRLKLSGLINDVMGYLEILMEEKIK